MVNRQIRKYSPDEIQTVLKTYEKSSHNLDDSNLNITNKVFIATISGDKKQGNILDNLRASVEYLKGQ